MSPPQHCALPPGHGSPSAEHIGAVVLSSPDELDISPIVDPSELDIASVAVELSEPIAVDPLSEEPLSDDPDPLEDDDVDIDVDIDVIVVLVSVPAVIEDELVEPSLPTPSSPQPIASPSHKSPTTLFAMR